jgi:hypothetical protein
VPATERMTHKHGTTKVSVVETPNLSLIYKIQNSKKPRNKEQIKKRKIKIWCF